MLQASYTKLLNFNNFVNITDNDKIYNTTPLGLNELIDNVNNNNKIEFLTIANYCKSLILNPYINQFNFELNDVLDIWEIRIICMIILNYKFKFNKINDKMLQFEANNIINQIELINSRDENNKLIELNSRFNDILYYLTFNNNNNNNNTQLLEYFYKKIFKARFNKDQLYINNIKFGIITILLKRKEFITVNNLIDDVDEIKDLNYEKAQLIFFKNLLFLDGWQNEGKFNKFNKFDL